MALTSCIECGRQISSEASQCPNCGIKIAKSASMGGALKVALCSLGIGIGIAALIGTSPSGTSSRDSTDSFIAISRCESALQARLKAPATAKFSGILDTKVRANDARTELAVLGHVDSQNSFGAMVRSKYVCFLRGSEGNWLVYDLTIE